ncbi:hypothetical protein LCL91_13445 [Alkalihalobacillus hwajinpoensis]|nr:hypothetical protein [Pseudalkalibacillus hwajinpoensis]MCA0992290.1 hypothetical protein [Pseudalkalibacillus hwajinpoensis]
MLDSCGTSGTGETPQERKRRGGSPPAPRKASILERKLTTYLKATISKKGAVKLFLEFNIFRKFCYICIVKEFL